MEFDKTFFFLACRVDVLFDINENENVDEGLNIEEAEHNQNQDDVTLPEVYFTFIYLLTNFKFYNQVYINLLFSILH